MKGAVPVQNRETPQERYTSYEDWKAYRRIFPFMRPYVRALLLVLAISFFATGLNLAQPYLTKLMIDHALVARDMGMLVRLSVVIVIVTIIGFGLNILASYRYVATSAAILFDIRSALLRHLQTLSPRFFGSFRLGDLMSRVNNDVSVVQRVAADTSLAILTNILMLMGSIVLMILLDWVLFLISAVLIPACVFAFLYLQKKLTHLTGEMRERSADIGSLLVDTVMGMRIVTALQAGEHEVKRFESRNNAFVDAMLRMQVASFLAGALPSTLLTLSTAAVILYGGAQIINGQMTIGTLVAFMTYQMRLFGPIQTLIGMMTNLATARVSLVRIFELFDAKPEVQERKGAEGLPTIRQGVAFDAVSLRHEDNAVLQGVSFSIPRGAFCAIVGSSGAGKSTMADLLVRYFDPDEGRVLIDGRDIRDFRLSDLRREILLVDQSTYLFNDTIAANIGFAHPDANEAEIARAARQAGLEDTLRRLPNGINTVTGERGMKVSAGEAQRIALARALLRKPSVLILDEPTSALDVETAAIVTDGLRQALPEATLIVITHSPDLARRADQVLTLKDGVVESRAPATLEA